jgi:hypothetical protein
VKNGRGYLSDAVIVRHARQPGAEASSLALAG